MGRKIVVTSGKGGVGKTTVTANLGLTVAAMGYSVALVDADIGLNNLDVALALENRVIYDIGDVADGRCRLKQALVSDERYANLRLLPSAKINSEKIKTAEFSSIVNELSASFDFVFIDSPAGIENGFHRAVTAAREAIVVVTPHISSVRDADKVVSLVSTYSPDSLGLVVNRVRGDMVLKGAVMAENDIASLLRVKLIGAIPEDDGVSTGGRLDDSGGERIKKAYSMLVSYVVNGSGDIYDSVRPYKGVLYRMFTREGK